MASKDDDWIATQPLKKLSTRQIEEIIEKALGEALGVNLDCRIQGIEYLHNSSTAKIDLTIGKVMADLVAELKAMGTKKSPTPDKQTDLTAGP